MLITDILGFQGYIVLILFVIALIMLYRIRAVNLDKHIKTGILGILLLVAAVAFLKTLTALNLPMGVQ